MFYKTVSMFIDPETKIKLQMSADAQPKAMVDFFNPWQLEERFGGAAPTPAQFWPPSFPNQNYLPVGSDTGDGPDLMNEEEYEQVIEENPLLWRRPDKMTTEDHNSRHFKADIE